MDRGQKGRKRAAASLPKKEKEKREKEGKNRNKELRRSPSSSFSHLRVSFYAKQAVLLVCLLRSPFRACRVVRCEDEARGGEVGDGDEMQMTESFHHIALRINLMKRPEGKSERVCCCCLAAVSSFLLLLSTWKRKREGFLLHRPWTSK